MHAFVAPILLRLARRDALGQHPELQQPYRECIQAAQGNAGERRPIVRANSAWQTVVDKGPFIAGASGLHPWSIHPLATEQKAAMVVGHGQRVTHPGITELELALEVGTPHVVGRTNAGKRLAVRRRVMAAPAWLYQTMALEHFANRTHCRPMLLWMFAAQPIAHCQRPPAQMPALERHDRRHLRGRSGMRLQLRRARAVVQPWAPIGLKAHQPFVTGRATHPKALTQLAHRELTA